MPPPSNSRKQPSQSSQPSQSPQAEPFGAPQQRTGRPQRQRVEKPHPPVAFNFNEVQENPPTRLSAASITPIAPSVRQSTFSELDDAARPSPVAADRPPLPPFPSLLSPTGHPPKPSEAERYKQRYLNRRTLPAPARSTTFAAATTAGKGRPRTQSLGSGSASSSSASTSTGEQQRSTASNHQNHHHNHHHHRRSPSNPTLPAIDERPLPAVPRRRVPIPTTQDPGHHVRFNTQPPKTAPHATPSDPPRLAKVNDDSRLNLTSPHPHPHSHAMNTSPTSTLVHGVSPLHEQHSSPKTPSKKRLFPINKNLHKFFTRGRSASVGCDDTTTTTTTHEQQKRPTTPTPTPNKFSSLPSISTQNISAPMIRRSTSHNPTRPRRRHPGDISAAAVKRVRRVTPLTEVDMDSKKEWRSSFINERKVPVYHPPAGWPYASNGR